MPRFLGIITAMVAFPAPSFLVTALVIPITHTRLPLFSIARATAGTRTVTVTIILIVRRHIKYGTVIFRFL